MSTLLRRLLDRDATLWPPENVSASRLGWLDVARRMETEADDLRAWANGIDASHVVLLGMGGSSLGAEVLRTSFGGDRLIVLDTTDPATVASVPVDDTFFLVSSKSGRTLEVDVLLAYFWAQAPDGRRYAAVTDPGTPLARLGEERGFTRVFLNPPDIGGRYSVLSYFGLVPGALAGADVGPLLQASSEVDGEAAVELGVAMGQAALEGRDKVTVVVPERFRAFGLWLEQLVAESTGKQGRGCVPVPTTEPELGDDRHVVLVDLEDPVELGAEFFRWELATAMAGHVLGVDPFDEPDVDASKANTRRVLERLPLPEVESVEAAEVSDWLAATVRPRDYVSLQAYLPFGQDGALERLRRVVRDGLGGLATTVGYGPRFLHSTGQLHKGGPDELVAVQLVSRSPTADVPVPGFPYDLATLIAAQSIGDYQVLRDRGRRVLRVELDDLKELG